MTFKKVTTLLLVTAMVIGSFAGCGAKKSNTTAKETPATETTDTAEATEAPVVEPEAVTLKVWAPQEEQNPTDTYAKGLLAAMCDQFQAEHPEYVITFDYAVLPESDVLTELQKDAAVGADVFMFASDQTSKLVESDLLYPITKDVEKVVSANTTASIAAATVEDQLYAFPFTPNTWFMYYDKSKYTEEEVLSLDTMLAKDLGSGVKNFAVDFDNSWYISSFFFANGCTLFGADGKDATECSFNNAKGLAVGNYLVDLTANKGFMDIADGNHLTALKEGKLAAACSGTWDAEAVKEALGENYAATKLPTIKVDGADLQLSNFADFKLVGVNTQTKAPLAALALADYLAGETCQKMRFEARSLAPTNLAVAEDPAVLENPAVAALSLQSSFSTLQSTIPQMTNYWTPAQAYGAGILSGEVTKDNMQAKLDELVKNILTALE